MRGGSKQDPFSSSLHNCVFGSLSTYLHMPYAMDYTLVTLPLLMTVSVLLALP